ncbi:response regulator [Catenovulum agarivorans]|uniref:response regulator n=1 Tax=Catenovulum agarivorans TaxID=1172192 RepID=UPI0002D59C3E|nr:response regulator [Catenovulum agarivorans]
MKIAVKLFAGFFIILVVVGYAGVVITEKSNQLQQTRVELTENILPISQDLFEIDKELQTSLAMLRGYLLLGNHQEEQKYFLANRAKSWRTIKRVMARLESMDLDSQFSQPLNEVSQQLEQFETIQAEIEALAWTSANFPSRVHFDQAYQDSYQQYLTQLNQLQAASLSKSDEQTSKLVTLLGELRWLAANTSLLLVDFVYGGKQLIPLKINQNFEKQQVLLTQINALDSIRMNSLVDLSNQVISQAKHIIELRTQRDWNKSVYLLSNEAIPLVDDIFANIAQLQLTISDTRYKKRLQLEQAESVIKDSILISISIAIVASAVVALFLSRYIVRNLNLIKEKAVQISLGRLNNEILDINEHDEIGQLKHSVNNMLNKFKRIAENAQALSQGDLAIEILQSSNEDEMAVALKNLLVSLKEIENQAKEIAQGNFAVEVHPRSDKDSLGFALKSMLASLLEYKNNIEKQNWIRTGVNKFNDQIRTKDSLADLCESALAFVSNYISSEVAIVYLVNQQQQLELFKTLGFSPRKQHKSNFNLNEGMLGKAVADGYLVCLQNIAEDYIVIESGAGYQAPKNLVIVPLFYKNKAIAVLEIALIGEFSADVEELLNIIAENLAIAIHMADERTKIDELLKVTQQQSADLEVANRELEEQTNALKDSENDLQQKQQELQAINVDLEQKTAELEEQKIAVEQRNVSLNNLKVELESRARDLEVTSRYKSEFLANMSHELRTPLNSLLLLAKSLKDNTTGHLDDEEVESADIIYRSGSDLLSLINEILDLSKIEAGKLDVVIEPVDLPELTEQWRSNFAAIAKNKGLDFDIVINAKDVDFSTDIKRLSQIIKNLLSNAFKFTQTGSVKLQVEQSDADKIEFKVIDTGIGIALDKQNVIFEAFQQANGSTNRLYGGTGLGLTISRELAALLGGEISLSSEEEVGSEFILTLPAKFAKKAEVVKVLEAPQGKKAVDETQVVDLAENTAELSVDTPTDIVVTNTLNNQVKPQQKNLQSVSQIGQTNKCILIIDDNQELCQVIAKQVRSAGFKTICGYSGMECIAKAIAYQPIGILLDLGLPDMDGWQVLDRLKQHPMLRHIPVHIITGQDTEELTAKLKGALGVTQKPIQAEAIKQSIKMLSLIAQKSSYHVLIVSPTESVLTELQTIMQGSDTQLEVTHLTSEAIEFIQQRKFDYLILDADNIDLESLTELLKQVEELPDNLPISVYCSKEVEEIETLLTSFKQNMMVVPAKSYTDVINESLLFLHRVESSLPVKIREDLLREQLLQEPMQNRTVLLVDDDMRNTFALAKLLTEKGLKVTKADNGQTALNLLDKQDFDLVLMDIMMPVMDGYQAIEKIRQQAKYKNLPIIALTAKAMVEDRQKCIEVGASDYLSKPIDFQKLLSVCRVWLS